MKSNLIINDTEHQQKVAIRKAYDADYEKKLQWAKENEAHNIYLEDENISPANAASQLGRPLSSHQLENILTKLNPNLIFEYNWWNPGMKAMYIPEKGEKKYLLSYHVFMPEHSVMKQKEETVIDYEQLKTPLKRSDLPKHEWVPGKGYVFDGLAPGWKKVTRPWGEQTRGWRTVLLKLIILKIITVSQVEKYFANPSSKFGQRAWAYHTGAQPKAEIPF